MRKTIHSQVAAVALALVATPSLAQQYEVPPSSLASEVAALGEDLTAGGRLEIDSAARLYYTDNYLSQHDNGVSAWGPILSPGATYSYALPRFKFSAGAQADFGWINVDTNALRDTNDSYTDSLFALGANWVAANRHSFKFGGEMQFGHDPFGTSRTEAANSDDELDKWRREAFDTTYTYNTPHAPLSVELRLGTLDRSYTTNRAGTRFLDYQRVFAESTVFYHLSPKTAALFDVIGSRTRYPDVFPGAFDRSSNELRYRAGLRWLASAKTTGDVRVGYVDRNHPDPRLEKFSALDWQVAVAWTPRSFTQISAQTGRHSQESYLNNTDFIDNRYAQVQWAYDWTALFSTRVSLSYINAEFVGTGRSDDFYTGGLALDYRLTPYLSLFGNGDYTSRTSSVDARSFDRLTVNAGVRFTR